MDYPRTLEGFTAAVRDAEWLANFHNRSFYIYVDKETPKEYSIVGRAFIVAATFAPGTSFYAVEPKEKV